MERTTSDFVVPAVFAILCCCTPLGIVSLVFALQARSHERAGDHAAAEQAATTARTWFWVSFWLGLLLGVVALLGNLASFAADPY